ncbi:hypothetical protein NIES21_57310 (plasmid) [Anabaenopsis circularis NIES-21]|uniref:Uncharacterized protein n=1 Tax=Anabaenopsis circularis NIES-21 TaxID=1085406 RepID=A0A1Z4GQR3_9CYAN|nr:hypothetical protein NIES21_57310 [Anabaenopsis circularis NIES-21]
MIALNIKKVYIIVPLLILETIFCQLLKLKILTRYQIIKIIEKFSIKCYKISN